MKIETLLDEYFDARYKFLQYHHQNGHAERERQYDAIRARILRMDAEKDEQEAMLRLTIDELRNELDEKGAAIKELLEISTQERLLNSEGLKNDSNNS